MNLMKIFFLWISLRWKMNQTLSSDSPKNGASESFCNSQEHESVCYRQTGMLWKCSLPSVNLADFQILLRPSRKPLTHKGLRLFSLRSLLTEGDEVGPSSKRSREGREYKMQIRKPCGTIFCFVRSQFPEGQ